MAGEGLPGPPWLPCFRKEHSVYILNASGELFSLNGSVCAAVGALLRHDVAAQQPLCDEQAVSARFGGGR
jgi:hypothetical protein